MAVDDFMILNDIITDPPEDNNCTIAMDDEQMTSHDRIRKILDKNYKKSVENTMRKYNKKVSKTNAKIEKGSFVTVRIPVVDRASGDLPRLLCRVDDIIGKDASLYKLSCEFGILNSCYDMGDIELLTRKIETEHWSTNGISLHAAAKQASFSLARFISLFCFILSEVISHYSDEEKAKLMEQEEYKVRMDEMPWLYLTCDLPPPPLYPDEMRENIIPQIPFSVLLSKFNGVNEKEYKTYKDSTMKRFEITQLPPYIIVYIKRFAKNYFITEKNPTIVNFPIKNVDFGDLLAPEIRVKHKCTTYDLMANIVHDGQPGPGKGSYRVHVLHKGTGKWYEMQDLHVIDILPQMIPLSESYIQIFELRRDIPNPTYGKSPEENVTMES
ncbi:SAD1 [Mytilus edulis]|uniref:ubiquitinyl hydrolase 1 n=1 Tax=Mytilus edulis TaxID=6550 RepID=A0A8S3SJ03_MYTED|nr:SAD1 [Mytilus edulis]